VSRLLWILQSLLALVFLFAGSFKLFSPLDLVQAQLPLPELAIRAIGTVEVLGAIGLIVPALTRIRPALTPLAAAGLVLLMTGATILSPVFTGDSASALLPLILGLLAAAIVYGRTRKAPIARRRARAAFGLATR
jgi:uncharacterized membrane protein YphA (DoxX/SURF4 family)